MSLVTMVHKYRDFVQGDISFQELRAGEPALTNHVLETMERGAEKLSEIFGADRMWFYYTLAHSIASLILDDATDDEIALITKITPAMANLVAGSVDEIGLNKQVQYTIVLGKDKK